MRIFVILGSRSDYNEEIRAICENPEIPFEIAVHIASCHRNPKETEEMLSTDFEKYLPGCDWIVAIGSMAFVLPGILKAWCHQYDRNIPVAGVALGEPGNVKLTDAQRSILGLPGQPVVFEEETGLAYTGPEGLKKLFSRIASGDRPVEKPKAVKPAEYFIYRNF